MAPGVLGLGGVFWDSISPPRRRRIASLDEQRSAEAVSGRHEYREVCMVCWRPWLRRQLAAVTH